MEQYTVAELVATGDADGGTGPVPVTVWRIAQSRLVTGDPGDDVTFEAHLAGMIVAFYSQPGDVVLSLGPNPDLAGAAGAHGCDFRAVTRPADLADLDPVAGRVALIVLPWPPPPPGSPDQAGLRDLFAACRMLLARDGATCVTLVPEPDTDVYEQYGPWLIRAAGDNGLELIRHILAVTEPVTGPHGHLRLTPHTADALLADRNIRKHMLLFVLGGTRG